MGAGLRKKEGRGVWMNICIFDGITPWRRRREVRRDYSEKRRDLEWTEYYGLPWGATDVEWKLNEFELKGRV
jgi:hypothetical protein